MLLRIMQVSKKFGAKEILLEMKYRRKLIPQDINEVEQLTIEHTIRLINKQIKSKSIEGINANDGFIIEDDFTDTDAWVHPIKIVERKTSISINMILQACTSLYAYELYQDANEICQKYQIRVVSKETDVEYAKRIGIICWACVKLASDRKFVSMTSNKTNVLKKNIKIRKRNVYEKNAKSKNISGTCYRK